MAGDYRLFPKTQPQGRSQGASRQGRSASAQRLPPGRPSSAINHSRYPSDASKSNMGDPPRAQSTLHYYPEQFYIDKNFDIDKALEYWGIWDSEIKLESHPTEQNKLSFTPSLPSTNRKPRNPSLKRAADLTDFIFNPDCPECVSTFWPTPQLPLTKPPGISLHKTQNSWSTVSTEDTPELTPHQSNSSSSSVPLPRPWHAMYNHTSPSERFSPCLPQPHTPEDTPKMYSRLSRPHPSLPHDEYVIFSQYSPGSSPVCPECSAVPQYNGATQTQSPSRSRPQPPRLNTQNSIPRFHKPRTSADSLHPQHTSQTNSASEEKDTRFSPSRPAPKPTGQRSASRPPSARKNNSPDTSCSAQPTVSDLSPECSQERSVWESDSEDEDGSKFRMNSLRKVKSKISLRRMARSSSRLSMVGDDTVPPLPTNIAQTFSKKNASTGSIQPISEPLRKIEPSIRSPSPLLAAQSAKTDGNSKLGNSQTPSPDISPSPASPEKGSKELKSNAKEVSRQERDLFYSCTQNQTDMNLVLPSQGGLKQAWFAIRSRMKVIACNKVRNTAGHMDFSGKAEKD